LITALHIEALAIARGERLLFENLDFRLAAGEVVALTGRNGAGKTSLLRAIAGLVRAERGQVRFEGASGALAAEDARSADTHLIGHQDGFKAGRRAWDELLFQVGWTGGTPASARSAAERLGLAPVLELEVRKLSAGQRRRLALARLLASPRRLWLLDEPLAPLDTAQRIVFGEVISEHAAGGGLVLAAVHDPLPAATRMLELGG
jgi:heme exporter protein A